MKFAVFRPLKPDLQKVLAVRWYTIQWFSFLRWNSYTFWIYLQNFYKIFVSRKWKGNLLARFKWHMVRNSSHLLIFFNFCLFLTNKWPNMMGLNIHMKRSEKEKRQERGKIKWNWYFFSWLYRKQIHFWRIWKNYTFKCRFNALTKEFSFASLIQEGKLGRLYKRLEVFLNEFIEKLRKIHPTTLPIN